MVDRKSCQSPRVRVECACFGLAGGTVAISNSIRDLVGNLRDQAMHDAEMGKMSHLKGEGKLNRQDVRE